MTKRKKNYLNNRDMLKEIHLSKISFCEFANKINDSQQDYIVEDILDITPEIVNLAKEARANRLSKNGTPTSPDDIKDHDIVIRLMTNEHIPLIPKKKSKAAQVKDAKKKRSAAVFDDLLEDEEIDELIGENDPNVEMVPMRVNFPPFFHLRIIESVVAMPDLWDENTEKVSPYYKFHIVGKSHWKNGKFSKNHGKTTDNLAMMYMKLCERYATRSNWRGYSYRDEMVGQALVQLTQIGLQFDEMKSSNPFAYYTQTVSNSFTRVLNIEKKMQNIRDDILEENGLTPSWTRQYNNNS